jgi:hypothetical protein
MRKGEKFDFLAKNGIRQDLEDRIGLERTKKTDGIIQGINRAKGLWQIFNNNLS